MPTAWTASAALSASAGLSARVTLQITIGVTSYYVTETSLNPVPPYTTESGNTNYTTEDGSDNYTIEGLHQRYITEAGVNAVGPFYVAAIGGGGITFAATAALMAKPTVKYGASAALAANAVLLAFPQRNQNCSAALSASATLLASPQVSKGATATLAARATFTAAATGPSAIASPLTATTVFSAIPRLHAAGLATFSATASFSALANVPKLGQASFTTGTIFTASGTVVPQPTFLGQAFFASTTAFFGYGTRVPYPPSIVGHALVYIVTAPLASQLTSDPIIGPLIGNSGVSVWHTQTDSVTQLPGAWGVIFMNNQPFDVGLAESMKCVLIYDQTALVQRKDSIAVVLKNDLTPPLSDIEIVVDGFGSLIMPSTLPSLIGV